MSSSLIATIITGSWLLLTILLAVSLASKLPADFMDRNYRGPIVKPHLAAKIAFLTIAGTTLATFVVWAVTSRVQNYYDYLLANLLPLLTGLWFIALVIAGILRQISRKADGFRWVVAVGLVGVVFFGYFAPTIKSISVGFLTKPYLFTGTVAEKNASTSKNGTIYAVAVDGNTYKVTRDTYAGLHIGETVELAYTEFNNMVFPLQNITLTWFGIVLLLLNLLSLSGAIAVVGYGL